MNGMNMMNDRRGSDNSITAYLSVIEISYEILRLSQQ